MSEQFDLFGEAPEPSPKKETPKPQTSGRILYFDLETQKSADDVGGWGNSHLMKMSVGVVWDSVENDYGVYEEDKAEDLVRHLQKADLVVGFNVIGFDYSVLQPYANKLGVDLTELPTHDMLADVHKKLNHRLSLDNLASRTLGETKSADGLKALQWYKEGKMDLIIEYCKQDVNVTRDLFLFGQENGFVKYDSRSRGPQSMNVDWNSSDLIKRLAKSNGNS
ncbi:MAG: DEAD/DEAH box helicase [Candidatus Nitronauta litoralis]|uniref:DEAD/DEAH box helicase n=1 Tax=Candidatus Nitronauta litoralis TaxID=2705533 RepID=A0A7T0G165_9BACT|nr:MAG: DEAD/DEAH box helicase [Candidatus Nitronauta litoralis]